MTDEWLSGPEILLRSDQPKSCLFCKDIPVATFQVNDDISIRANHYVRVHEFQIVADYESPMNGSTVRFVELDKHGQRSEQAKKILASQGLVLKRNFQPQCPVHGRLMVRLAPVAGSFLRFRCSVYDCGILWDRPGGYGRETGHTLPYYSSLFPMCPTLGHGVLFIRSVTGDSTTWECPVESCNEIKTTKQAETPGEV
jgi:hypothetical protein